MKYKMTAECLPKNNNTWFDGFGEGLVIDGDFDSQEDAQEYLNEQCLKAETNNDRYYDDHGPAAVIQNEI